MSDKLTPREIIELCLCRWEQTNKEGAFKPGEYEAWVECAETILEELER